MDAERFRREVIDWLRPRLARVPTAEDSSPSTAEWIAQAFDGRLKQYLEIGRATTTALWHRVAEVIHASGARIQTNLATPATVWNNDLDPSINNSIDRAIHNLASTDDEVRQEVRDLLGQMAPGGEVFVTMKAREKAEQALLATEVQAAAHAGARGGIFYNYDLLREEQLRSIGAALRSL